MKCITYSNISLRIKKMLLAYAHVMVSDCDDVVSRTGVPCLYQEMMEHTA